MDHCAQIQTDSPAWHRTASQEFVNAVTHGFGLLLALVGAFEMAGGLSLRDDGWLAIGCGAYLASLVAVFAMSTLSHGMTVLKWKTIFRQLDQGFIYLLIVATYTPFSLAFLHGTMWSALLAGMWVVALLGFVTKVFLAHRVESVSIASYVLLAWVPILSVPELSRTAPAAVLGSIFAGGFCYTVGTLFLINDERVRHFHAIWHVCVIAGCGFHFMGIFEYVAMGVR